jgi:hypothetical protein
MDSHCLPYFNPGPNWNLFWLKLAIFGRVEFTGELRHQRQIVRGRGLAIETKGAADAGLPGKLRYPLVIWRLRALPKIFLPLRQIERIYSHIFGFIEVSQRNWKISEISGFAQIAKTTAALFLARAVFDYSFPNVLWIFATSPPGFNVRTSTKMPGSKAAIFLVTPFSSNFRMRYGNRLPLYIAEMLLNHSLYVKGVRSATIYAFSTGHRKLSSHCQAKRLGQANNILRS